VHVETSVSGDPCVVFAEAVHEFSVQEDVLPGIAVGDLRVLDGARPEDFHFELLPSSSFSPSLPLAGEGQAKGRGGGNVLFAFDEKQSNRLLVVEELDAEALAGDASDGDAVVLLNIRVCYRL
jgi:hypothetical protein